MDEIFAKLETLPGIGCWLHRVAGKQYGLKAWHVNIEYDAGGVKLEIKKHGNTAEEVLREAWEEFVQIAGRGLGGHVLLAQVESQILPGKPDLPDLPDLPEMPF